MRTYVGCGVVVLCFLSIMGCSLSTPLVSQKSGSEPSDQPVVAVSAVAEPIKLTDVKSEDEEAQLGLQFGAFSTSGAATNHLSSFKLRYPLLFEGRSAIVRTKEQNGLLLYRTILGPFRDYELASEFCIQLKEKQEDCFVTEYNLTTS